MFHACTSRTTNVRVPQIQKSAERPRNRHSVALLLGARLTGRSRTALTKGFPPGSPLSRSDGCSDLRGSRRDQVRANVLGELPVLAAPELTPDRAQRGEHQQDLEERSADDELEVGGEPDLVFLARLLAEVLLAEVAQGSDLEGEDEQCGNRG